MAHEVISGVFGQRVSPWHFAETGKDGRSLVVDGLLDTREALRLSGVGGLITRPAPIFVKVGDEYREVPDFIAVQNIENHEVLGVNGDGYQVEQFGDAFLSLGDAFGEDAKVWETMVLLRGGRVAAGVLRFPEFDRKLIDGSTLMVYIAAYSSHDGSFALTYTDTNIRLECMNRLRAIDSRQTGRRFAIRHGSTLNERKVEAVRVMTFAQQRVDAMAEQAEKLVAQKLSERQITEIMDKLVPVAEENGRGRTMALNKRSKVMSIYKDSPDLQGLQGTAWGFLQAVGDYVDHCATYRTTQLATSDENRFIRTVLQNNTIADEALRLLVTV